MWIFDNIRKNSLNYVTGLLLAIVLICLPAYTEIGKKAFYLLAFLSLIFFIKNFRDLKQLDPIIKLFFVVIAVNFIWTLFTFYLNDSPGRGSNFVWNRQFFILFIPPLYLLFRHVKIPFYLLWSSVVVSVLLAAYVGHQDTLIEGQRARGGMHPILFGSIMLCEAIYLLVVSFTRDELWIKVLSFCGFVLGVVVVIWSQSRGVWAAMPVLLALVSFVFFRKVPVNIKLILFVAITGLVIVLTQHPIVQQKLNTTFTNIERYQAAEHINDSSRSSSIGTRFEMWKAGWQIFLENPVLGVGVGGYDQAAKENAKRYGVNESAYWFYHPHNQYISALSTKGFIGFILLFAMLVLPFYLAKSRWQENDDEPIVMIAVISLAYMIFSLSDVPLEGKATIIFYTIAVAVFVSNLKSKPDSDCAANL